MGETKDTNHTHVVTRAGLHLVHGHRLCRLVQIDNRTAGNKNKGKNHPIHLSVLVRSRARREGGKDGWREGRGGNNRGGVHVTRIPRLLVPLHIAHSVGGTHRQNIAQAGFIAWPSVKRGCRRHVEVPKKQGGRNQQKQKNAPGRKRRDGASRTISMGKKSCSWMPSTGKRDVEGTFLHSRSKK